MFQNQVLFTAKGNLDKFFYQIYIKYTKANAVKLSKRQKKKKGLVKINFWL